MKGARELISLAKELNEPNGQHNQQKYDEEADNVLQWAWQGEEAYQESPESSNEVGQEAWHKAL